jgi:predicted PurR-regulated permease PerM
MEAGRMTQNAAPRPPRRNRNGLTPARIVIIGAMALVLAITLLGGVWLTANTLALLFAAIVIAEAISPLIERMARFMPRGLAVGAVYLLLIGIVGGILWYVIPDLARQATTLAERIPEVTEEVTEVVDEVTEEVENSTDDAGMPVFDDVESTVREGAARLANEIVTFSGTLVSSITQMFLIAFMSAYWLISRSALFDFVRSLAPRDGQEAVDGTIDAFSETVGGYVRGVAISAVIVGVLSYIGLTIIGVQYALVLALVAAFGELLPVVGPILAAIPAVIVAFFESPTQAVIVAVFYLVLQQVESNVIMPNVMKNQADVPPLLTLVAITAGGTLAGILGAVIAIPLVGVLKVMVVRIVAPGIRRWTGATRGPTTVEEAHEAQEAEAT